MDSFTTQCPACKATFQVRAALAGRTATCKKCHKPFTVTDSSTHPPRKKRESIFDAPLTVVNDDLHSSTDPRSSTSMHPCSQCGALIPSYAPTCNDCKSRLTNSRVASNYWSFRKISDWMARHSLSFSAGGQSDPHRRTHIPTHLSAPKYFGINFIALMLIVLGSLVIVAGVVSLSMSVYARYQSQNRIASIRSSLGALDNASEAQREAVARAEKKAKDAGSDKPELVEKWNRQRKQFESDEQQRMRQRMSLESELAAHQLGKEIVNGTTWAVGIGAIISGLIIVGLGQVFSAIRDMAINSFLIASKKPSDR